MYIRNLMMSTTEQELEQLFIDFLQNPKAIERVKKINDFAFVHFTDREDAKKCLERFNDQKIDQTTVEITWAKPPDKNAQSKQQQQQQQQQGLHQLHPNSPVKFVDFNGIPLLALGQPPFFNPGYGSAVTIQQNIAMGRNNGQKTQWKSGGGKNKGKMDTPFDPSLSGAMFPSQQLDPKVLSSLQEGMKNSTISNGPQQPSDHNEQQQQPMLTPNFIPSSNTTASMKSPSQMLEDFCAVNGLPAPSYHMYVQYLPTTYISPPGSANPSSNASSPGSANDDGEKANERNAMPITITMFAYIVTVPGYTAGTSPRFCVDQNEAKNLAASVALSQMTSIGYAGSPGLFTSNNLLAFFIACLCSDIMKWKTAELTTSNEAYSSLAPSLSSSLSSSYSLPVSLAEYTIGQKTHSSAESVDSMLSFSPANSQASQWLLPDHQRM